AVGAHLGRDEQVQDKRRPKMQPHRAIEILQLHMLNRTDFDNARVVDQDVDLVEALQCLLHSRLDLRGLEQIGLQRQNLSSESVQVSFGVGEFFRVPRNESDAATLCT